MNMLNAAFEQSVSIEMIHNLGTVKRNGIEIDPDNCQINDVVTDVHGNEYTIKKRNGNMVTIVKHTASSTQSAHTASFSYPATAAASKGGMKKRRAHKRHTKKRHTKKRRTHKYRARK